MSPSNNPVGSAPSPATFLGLPHCGDLSQLDAAVAILGVPVATPYPTAGLFAAHSPAAIRAAISTYSRNIGHHDFEIDGSLLEKEYGSIVDATDLSTSDSDYAANRSAITSAVQHILAAGAAPVVIGGDDSVPIPVLQAYEGRGPITILQIDAHIDWRDEVSIVREISVGSLGGFDYIFGSESIY